eukprot:jgi/Mesen1/5737/ME000029S05047
MALLHTGPLLIANFDTLHVHHLFNARKDGASSCFGEVTRLVSPAAGQTSLLMLKTPSRNGRNGFIIRSHFLGRTMDSTSSLGTSSNTSKKDRRNSRLICRGQGDDSGSGSSGDASSAESLFLRELRRRGISSEGGAKSEQKEVASSPLSSDPKPSEGGSGGKEEGSASASSSRGNPSSSGSSSTGAPRWVEARGQKQLELSRALNSEGLEGLPARAWELVKLGGAFSLSFGPLVLVLVAVFAGCYLYFGNQFIHPGRQYWPNGAPPYVEPYQLLDDEDKYGFPQRVPFREPPPPSSY